MEPMNQVTQCPYRFPFPHSSDAPLDLAPQWAAVQGADGITKAVLPEGHHAWLIASHQAVRTALQDPALLRGGADGIAPYPAYGDDLILVKDGPELRQLRGLAADAFTPAAVARHREALEALTSTILDDMLASGPPVDLTARLGLTFTMTTITRILGIPAEDRALVQRWSDQMVLPGGEQEALNAFSALTAYIQELLNRRRSVPAEDVLSQIAHRAHVTGVSTRAAAQFAVALVVGGWETTSAAISGGTYRLLTTTHPDAGTMYRHLHANPRLLNNAVEEILRLVPSSALVTTQPRRAARDTEIAGVTIREGELVLSGHDAASRDPAVFPDPTWFDIERDNAADHLAFGLGPHVCIGSHLARLELRTVFGALTRRLPDLQLAVRPEDLRWDITGQIRRPDALPVTWNHPISNP